MRSVSFEDFEDIDRKINYEFIKSPLTPLFQRGKNAGMTAKLIFLIY
jgi:hypothetical protein